MTILQILPTLFSLLGTVIIALVGWGYKSDRAEIKNAIQQNAANITKNSDSIEKVASRQADKIERLETDFNSLKADLPFVYVLQEDFVRTMNNVETRIVGVDGKLDRVLEKMTKGGNADG